MTIFRFKKWGKIIPELADFSIFFDLKNGEIVPNFSIFFDLKNHEKSEEYS